MDDSHTRYFTQQFFRSAVAFLPFSFAPYHDTRGTVLGYVVIDVATDFAIANPTFTVGATIQSWNGVPVGQAVEQEGLDEHGSNIVAQRERAIGTIRFRSLGIQAIPAEESVKLSYLSATGSVEEIVIPWIYLIRSSPATDNDPLIMEAMSSVDSFEDSLNEASIKEFSVRVASEQECLNRTRKEMEVDLKELSRQASKSGSIVEVVVTNRLSSFVRAQLIPTACGVLTKITLASFPLETATRSEVQADLASLLRSVPRDGLVIDIRANTGGSQILVFVVLRMITSIEFECPRFNLRATALVNAMVNSPNARLPDSVHRASMRTALAVGDQYTNSNEISDINSIISVAQVYFSKFVVIGNGRSFSAGDVFAAIVKDNGLAQLILEGGNTGAGGSTVRQYSELRERNPQLYPALPTGVDFFLSIARVLRPADSRGAIVENFGVDADLTYFPTLDDRLNKDWDLMDTAARKLRGAFCTGV
ncbi:Peptidase S41 [Gracilaria domingensis]|nr:Peptidase S41 [Gracilaria domingensis]